MDQSLTDDATRRLRGADGKFIAANERVIMYDHTAGDLSVDPSRSSSVGNPSEGDDGNLQTRYRQKPMLAPNTKAEATKTTSRSRWRAPLTDEEMWSKGICDGGKAALAVTRGISSSEAIPDPVIFASMLLDPEALAPDLATWKKEFNRTMPRLAQAYATHRPDIANGVAELTKSSGYECRVQIDRMVQTIFSADKMHPAAIYCLMLLLWYDHPKSQKHDTISLTVEDYLLTDDDSVDELLRASERGSTLNTTLVGHGHLDKSAATDGLLRLDPNQNGDFTQNWLELWSCAVNALCYTHEMAPLQELTAAKAAWLITDTSHALMARHSERVKDVVARHVAAIRKLAMLVNKMGPPHTTPDVIAQGTNLLKAFAMQGTLIRELKNIIKRKPSNPAGIDWANAIDLLTEAELALDRPTTDQLAEVFQIADTKTPDTHAEDDTDYENDIDMAPNKGETPDAADKGAAKPIIKAATPPEVPDAADKGAAEAIIMTVIPTDPDPPTAPYIGDDPTEDSDDY